MAHMIDGKGPYPDKAGEFCGNHLPGSPPCLAFNETPREAERHQREWLSRMRFGKPSRCKAGSSEEMAADGCVGLYLKEDRPLRGMEIAMDTKELQDLVRPVRPWARPPLAAVLFNSLARKQFPAFR